MLSFGRILFLLTFFALLLLSLFVFSDKVTELLSLPLLLALGGITAYFLNRDVADPDSDFQLDIFFWAFSIRLWMGFVLYGLDLSAVFGDEDASGYLMAWNFAENWYKNGFDGFLSDLFLVLFQKQNIGQGIIWGVPTFFAGGPSRMIVSVINSFAGALLVIVMFRMARRIFDNKTARVTAILVAFWASFILVSAGTSKEMLVILFEWFILYLVVRNPRGLSYTDVLIALPAFAALYVTRFYALYMVAAAFLFRTLFVSGRNIIRNSIIGFVIIGTVAVVLSSSGVINRDFDRLDSQNRGIVNWRQGVASSTGSGINIYAEYEGSSIAIPVATVYFFLAPFPWEVFSGGLRGGFAAVENVLIIVILIIGFPAIKVYFRDTFPTVFSLLIFCVLYAGFHIWGLANVGLAWRHKQTVMPLFFMLVGLSIAHRKASWRIISQNLSRKEKK